MPQKSAVRDDPAKGRLEVVSVDVLGTCDDAHRRRSTTAT